MGEKRVVRVTGLEITRWGFTKKQEMPKTRTITGFVAGVPIAGFHRISRIFAGFPMNNAQIMPTKMTTDKPFSNIGTVATKAFRLHL